MERSYKFAAICLTVFQFAMHAYSASLLDVNFEDQTAGSQPTGTAYLRPTANSTTQAVQIVESTLLGGTRAVQYLDRAVNIGTSSSLQYNFANNGAVVCSFSFSPSYVGGSSANYLSVGLGQQVALSSAASLFSEVRLRADGSIAFYSAGTFVYSATGLAVGSSNTASMVVNDTADAIVYAGGTLAANKVDYYFNGSLVYAGASFGATVGALGTTNGPGRVAIFDSTARTDLDYLVDNITVSEISPPPAFNVSATAAAPTGSGTGTGGLTVAEGFSITLTETPSAGTAPFTYAWKKVGSGDVLGTNSTILISSPTNGAQYTCDVAATWDGVTNTSPAATLTVLPLVSATAAMPTGNGSGSGGMTVYAQRTRMTLTETPSGGTEPFTYAWRKVGEGTVLGTNSTLTVSSLISGDQYVCDVASSLDGVTNTSPAATVTVTSAIDSSKVVFVKADDIRITGWYLPAWTNFITASSNLGVKIGLGVIASNMEVASSWLQTQEATGEIEFWNHGFDHSKIVVGSITNTEFDGTSLAFMQQHMADAQTILSNALGKDAIAFGTPYNGFDTNTAIAINETTALKLAFVTSTTGARSDGLDNRVAAVRIISESDGTGLPNATAFKSAFPPGTAGPAALQFHPANFTSTGITQYVAIVEYLLTNGYVVLTPAEYVAWSDPLAASFSASPTNGGAPLTVTFTDTSTGAVTNRYWDFGDGVTTNTTAISLSHIYSVPGTSTVTLIVSDASGSSTNIQTELIVATEDTLVTTTNVIAFTTSGTWICPAGITNIRLECWGGGGAGGSAFRPEAGSTQYGGGGAGGAYARYNSYPVIPGNTYYIQVGAGGVNNSSVNDTTVPGGDSWFNSINEASAILIARGGAGGESAIGITTATSYGTGGTGTANGSTGDIVYAGGSGATGATSAAGGGGSSAGTSSAGTSATSNIGATAPSGGGNGGTGPTTSSGVGAPGYTPGGGGSGGRDGYGTLRTGGTGGSGQISLSYTTVSVGVSATAATPVGNGSGLGGLTTYAQRTCITLTETPSAGTGPFTYAWKKVGLDTVLGTNNTLVVSPPVNGDQYTCDVAATWNGVTNTSSAATVTVTAVINPAKVAIIKADAFRALGPAWTNFLTASRDLGVKVSIGPICTNNISPDYAVSNPTAYQSTTNWMQTQQAVGDVEFFEYGWTHTTWLDTNGATIYEYKGSGLAFQQENLAKAQSAISNAIGRNAVAFGPSFNQVDTDTAIVINDTSALKMLFVSNADTAQAMGLNSRIATAIILNEDNYGDGTGKPNAAVFKAAFPSGPAGPVALQFHPSDASFNADRVVQYQEIVQYLLTNGYTFLLPSEYVASMPVYASFSASPTNGGAPLTVTFTDSSLGTPTNRYWSFGDGTTTNITATSLTYTYSFPGTNTVRLIVRDASGVSTNTKSGLIVAASVDTVGDGIPDWWRVIYFPGDPIIPRADEDSDNDGISNLDEYLADTVPTNAASRLAITSFMIVSNQVRLVWTGGSSAWQYVEYRNSLMDTNGWRAVYTNIPPTAVTNTLFDAGEGTATSRFYRIKAWR